MSLAVSLLFLASFLQQFISSSSLTWNDIHWIISTNVGDSQVKTCKSSDLQPIDMDSLNISWNETVYTHVVENVLQRNISKTGNSFGIQGCCAPGLWCRGSICYTQSFGDQFTNYGWLASDSTSQPVYTCWNATPSEPTETAVVINRTVISSNQQFSLYGSGFGVNVYELNIPLNSSRCRNAAFCECVACSGSSHICPIGSSCFYTSSVGYFCYPLCAGSGDKACSCGRTCTNKANVFGDVVSLCLPGDFSDITTCTAHGGQEIMCNASDTLYSLSQSSAVELSLVVDAGGDYVYTNYTRSQNCESDSVCHDGNPCTVDSCSSSGVCSHSYVKNCDSMPKSYEERYTPYVYNRFSINATLSDDELNVLVNKTTQGSDGSDLSSTDSSDAITLPFWVFLFGGLLNEIKIYGNGIIAFPPYASCPETSCGVFSTATNLLSAWYSPLWTDVTYWTYTQTIEDVQPLLGVNASAFHILLKLYQKTDDTVTSKMEILVSIYEDSSIRYSYLTSDRSATVASTEWVGLWGSSATGEEKYFNNLRYHSEKFYRNDDDDDDNILRVGKSLSFCYVNTTACLPSACVTPQENLSIYWNMSTSCLAAGENSSSLDYLCSFYGGAVTTVGSVVKAPGSDQLRGILSCPVPSMDIDDGSLVPLDILLVYHLSDGSTVTSATVDYKQGIPSGSKSLYMVSYLNNTELTRSRLLIRYYHNTSTIPASCGCSALAVDSYDANHNAFQCDNQGVCGGSNDQGDCYGTPFGAAFHDACDNCVAGYTQQTPQFACTIDSSSSAYLDIISQTIILLIIICCMTVITSTISYSIRRMLIRRAQQQATFLTETELAMEILEAAGGRRGGRRGLSEFECDALGQRAFTREFWLQHCKVDRSHTGKDANPVVATPVTEAAEKTVSSMGETCDCSICLMEITEGSMVRVLPEPCGHIFHVECIDPWLKQSALCPLCKRSMRSILIGDEEENRMLSADRGGIRRYPGGAMVLEENGRTLAIFGFNPRNHRLVRSTEPRVVPSFPPNNQMPSDGSRREDQNSNVALSSDVHVTLADDETKIDDDNDNRYNARLNSNDGSGNQRGGR